MIAGDTPRNVYTTVLRAIGLKESSVCVARPARFRPQTGVTPNRYCCCKMLWEGGVQYAPYQEGIGLKSQGMSVAVIPMLCMGNRLCRGFSCDGNEAL